MERREIQLKGGGQLSLWEEGNLVRLQAVRTDDKRGLYKVWICGQGGRKLLGTLAPEGGRLCLGRRLSRSELERSGCWPVTGGESVLAFSFEQPRWRREEHPERLVRDEVICRALRGTPVLLRRQGDGFCLAAGYDSSRPFPLPALFCFAKLERVEGSIHAVFSFDREGNPVVAHNGRDGGENRGTS